jgi:GAF domain-containing protein
MSQSSNERIESEWLTALDHAWEIRLDQLLRRIIEIATELFSADAGGIYLFDEGEEKLRLIFRSGEESPVLNPILRLGEGLAGQVAQTRKPITIRNYGDWADRSLIVEKKATQSFIAIPLTTSTKTLGVLYLSSTAGRHFTSSDMHLLTSWSIFATTVLTSAARLEYVRKTVASQEGLITQIDQLSRTEWEIFVEGFLQGVRDGIQGLGTADELETQPTKPDQKLAAINRLRGSFKTASSPTDDELKENYANYLIKKYS